jgi:hypothetical protein
VNGALTQKTKIKYAAHGSANQALDFLGAPTLLTLGRFAITTGVGGAWQHAVLGSYPAFARAFFVGWNPFQDAGRTKHFGIAKGN